MREQLGEGWSRKTVGGAVFDVCSTHELRVLDGQAGV